MFTTALAILSAALARLFALAWLFALSFISFIMSFISFIMDTTNRRSMILFILALAILFLVLVQLGWLTPVMPVL